MKLQIRILSPLHIGSGEKYNGLSYVEKNGIVKFYDSTKVIENLTTQYSVKFVDWIEQKITLIERLEMKKKNERDEQKRKDINIQLMECKKKLSLKEFLENSINDEIIKNMFNQNFLYEIESRTRVLNNVDVDCFIKQNNKPYIPGSEIKGAIRTAIAAHLLQSSEYWSWLEKNLRDFESDYKKELQKVANQKGKEVNELKKKLVREMAKIEQALEDRLFRSKEKDMKYDFMKFLHIGDSELKEPSECLFVSDLRTLNISRRFSVFQEFCKKDLLFTSDIRLEYNEIILNKLGFREEQKRLISDIRNIFKCCYEFSKKMLDEEIAYQPYPQQVIEKLNHIRQENNPNSPVIRIGKNQGYLSLTMGLVVKEKDKELYNKVLCHATKNTSYTNNFPKTRRIVSCGGNDFDTCGWVKLIVV